VPSPEHPASKRPASTTAFAAARFEFAIYRTPAEFGFLTRTNAYYAAHVL
jgi:hypothetical protein